jgi:DNA (cytosine-5)-methyltransferase 1
MSCSPIAVDLFAGAGGLSLGARRAGIKVALAVEVDPLAVATYRHNHPDTAISGQDIRHLRYQDLPKTREGCLRILFGGPPCQGFSTSNQRTRNRRNPVNWLFEEYVRMVRLWQPECVVFENVPGLRDTEGGTFYRKVLRAFAKLRYCTTTWILDAADFGVPQHRSRLFIIGVRQGPSLPPPAPSPSPQVSVRHAISDLPILRNGASVDELPYRTPPSTSYALAMRGRLKTCGNHLVTRNSARVVERYGYVPQGGNWANIPRRLMRNYGDPSLCHTGIYHRLRADSPAIVIGNYRKNMLIHPTQNRGLSVREAARLQSFPDSYTFLGSIGFQQQQVGNAVPPLLGEAVFRRVVQWFADKS